MPINEMNIIVLLVMIIIVTVINNVINNATSFKKPIEDGMGVFVEMVLV